MASDDNKQAFSSEPIGDEFKRQKTMDTPLWENFGVQGIEGRIYAGISEHTRLVRKPDFPHQSLCNLKGSNSIEDQYMFGMVCCSLHKSFKVALDQLLSDMEDIVKDTSNKCEIYLVHGTPKIGKSTLARCLAHKLALEGGKSSYIKLAHQKEMDSEVLTYNISKLFMGKWVIIDQCNMNKLEYEKFNSYVIYHKKSYNTPIIVFTSGHYPPGEQWVQMTNSGCLKYKIIDIQCQEDAIAQVKKHFKVTDDKGISDGVLLGVTKVYGLIQACIVGVIKHDPEPTEDTLRRRVYKDADLEFLAHDKGIHAVCLAWPGYMNNLPPENEMDVKLEVQFVQYLCYLSRKIQLMQEDANDDGMNAIWNWLNVAGEAVFNENGYYEYDPHNYHYFFPYKKPLYGFLKYAANKYMHSPKSQYDAIKDAYEQMPQKSYTEFINGSMFELMISLHCAASQKLGRPEGLCITCTPDRTNMLQSNFVPVGMVKTVATIDELCNLPSQVEKSSDSCWCMLNKDGSTQFTGYDFVFMKVENKPGQNPTVLELQLLKAAVHPENKKAKDKANMVSVFNAIKKQMKEKNLIQNDSAVVPYFVPPHCEEDTGVNDITLQKTPRIVAKSIWVALP